VEKEVIRCLDLDEESPLPDDLKKGNISFEEVKNKEALKSA
jgi:hypothetical protein